MRQAGRVGAGLQTHVTHAVNFALHSRFHQVLIEADTSKISRIPQLAC